MKQSKTRQMVFAGVLTGLIIVMSSVPVLGYIPLGVINATIIQVPVIIGAILLGPKYGAFLGLVFGLSSMIKNTFAPNATSFVFSPFYQMGEYGGNFYSVLISLVPRILIGPVSWAVYRGLRKLIPGHLKETASLAAAGAAGALTNTLLVMNMIYLFFGESYLAAGGGAYKTVYGAILAIIAGVGIPEAIVSAVLTALICRVMLRFIRHV